MIRGGGLKPAADARAAFGPLDNEYASGAVDLRDAIGQAAKEFDGKVSRQQVILYLGDGESALNPLEEADRYKLADDLRSGSTLSEALERQKGKIPPYYGALVAAGIRTGRISEVLATLSVDQRDVLLLRILGGLTIAEIAMVLRKKEGAVKMLQARGLAAIRKQISAGAVTL